MKKMMNWMLAAILAISSASFVSSCSNEDVPVYDGLNVCASYTVEYNFVHPAANSKYFVTKWALWTSQEKRDPLKVYSKTVSGGYSFTKDDVTFPAHESFFVHAAVKDSVNIDTPYSYDDRGTYTITTFNGRGKVLDKKTENIGYYSAGGAGVDRAELELAAEFAYVEVNCTIAKDGKIALETVALEADSKSGIKW